jgi:hypothetical protein
MTPPVDLRAIPVDHWQDHLCRPVLLPPDVAHYIAGMDGPPTVLEKDHIEERVMAFHSVQPPWVIVFRNKAARLMRE